MFNRKQIKALAKSLSGEESVEYPESMIKDSLLPKVGNRFAYEHRDPEPRIHVVINIDDVGFVNEQYGHAHGDQLIRATGELLADHAARQEGETYRLGGDTFAFLFEKPQQVELFLRDGTMAFKDFTPIGAYGRPSFSAGVGQDLPSALASLETAKTAKRERHGDSRDDPTARVGHGLCYIHNSMGNAAGPEEEPAIPDWMSSPRRTNPIESAQPQPPPLSQAQLLGGYSESPPEGEQQDQDRTFEEGGHVTQHSMYGDLRRSEQVPDFALGVQSDVL